MDDKEFESNVAETMNMLSRHLHEDNVKAGWWTEEEKEWLTHTRIGEGELYDPKKRKLGIMIVATKLCLAHSEISESLEGIRKGLMDDHLPHRSMFEVEIADVLIRLFDLAGATGIDLGGAMIEKLAYNKQRKDHKKEHRDGVGGKTI